MQLIRINDAPMHSVAAIELKFTILNNRGSYNVQCIIKDTDGPSRFMYMGEIGDGDKSGFMF